MTRLLDAEPEAIKAARIRAENDALAVRFKLLCQANGLPLPVREYRFDSSPAKRMWTFDFCWPNIDEPGGLALEQDGGLFVRGRHARGAAIIRTHDKLNAAACQHWRILYCTPDSLCASETIDLVRRALGASP